MKLRTAWGQAGKAPAPFTADRAYAPDVTVVGDVAVNQLSTASYGNPDLKAETGSELEIGFDASFMNGRMALEATYYNQRTTDALIQIPDPPSSGFSGSHFVNIGEISNSGFEVLLTGTPVYTRNVQWDASLSLYTNGNELVSFGGLIEEIAFGAFAQVHKHREGYPLGGYWYVDVQRDASGNPVLNANGSAIVDFDNEVFVGPQLPTRELAFSNTFTLLGNLRIFAQLDYKGGNYQWCAICSHSQPHRPQLMGSQQSRRERCGKSSVAQSADQDAHLPGRPHQVPGNRAQLHAAGAVEQRLPRGSGPP